MKKLLYLNLTAAAMAVLFAVSCKDTNEKEKSGTVTDEVPERVEVSPATLNFAMSDADLTEMLTATVFPEDLPAEAKEVTWKSDNDQVATVADGLVSAVGEGTATITVTTKVGGKKASCTVTVTRGTVAVTGIALSPKTGSCIPGGYSEVVTATIAPADATDNGIAWTVEAGKESIAAVELVNENDPSKVRIKGLAVGEATITATTADGGHTDTFTMTVSEVPPATVKIMNGGTELGAGDTFEVFHGTGGTLTAVVGPDNAGNKAVKWKAYRYYGSTDPMQPQAEEIGLADTFININADTGVVTANKPSGSVPLTVVAATVANGEGGTPIVATCKVVVKPVLVNAFTGLPTETFDIEMGEVKTLVPYNSVGVLPAAATYKTWRVEAVAGTGSVSIENELMVDIKGTAVGTAQVRFIAGNTPGVPDDDYSTLVNINVTAPANIPTAVNITSDHTADLTWAAKQTITGTVTPAIAGQELKFESLTPTIATVTSAGVVSALDYGVATIRVKSSVKEDVYTDVSITVRPLGVITFLNGGATYEIRDASEVLVQTWTDAAVAAAITSTGKNRPVSSYNGGSNGNWLDDAVIADSSSGSGGGGTLFSWGLINKWGNSQICPAGYRVPTGADYLTLDKTLVPGKTYSGGGYTDTAAVATYLSKWNQAYGGYWTYTYQPASPNKGTLAIYWTSEAGASATASGMQMYIAKIGGVYPNSIAANAGKSNAAQLRCVKNAE